MPTPLGAEAAQAGFQVGYGSPEEGAPRSCVSEHGLLHEPSKQPVRSAYTTLFVNIYLLLLIYKVL